MRTGLRRYPHEMSRAMRTDNTIHDVHHNDQMIRPMRATDCEELYNIALRSLNEIVLPEVFYGFFSQWQNGQFISCDFLGKPIGFICSTRLYDGGCRIMLFAMDTNVQGRGKGTELLNALIGQARMERVRYLTLEVRAENARARSFYKRHGFIELETLPCYYSNGGDAVRMDLFLA